MKCDGDHHHRHRHCDMQLRCPKPLGGFAARMQPGSPSPNPCWGSAPDSAGGSRPRPPSGTRVGAEPQLPAYMIQSSQ
ncbi:MAG: hypothetical protein GY696_31265 [Gammaproteobacteria bacterium]|nr:hypothetical protein [Gammaproteobacteria bacterium]